jgi:hypothetical protein
MRNAASNIIPRSTVNGYLIPDVDINDLGDWQGEERAAAERFNRLLAIVAQTLPACDETFSRGIGAQEHFDAIGHAAWDSWGSDAALLTATDDDFRRWVALNV